MADPIVGHLRATIAGLEDDLRDRNARVADLLMSRDAARAERDRYGQAIDQVAAAVAVFKTEMGGLEPSGVTGTLLAAIERAIGGVR